VGRLKIFAASMRGCAVRCVFAVSAVSPPIRS